MRRRAPSSATEAGLSGGVTSSFIECLSVQASSSPFHYPVGSCTKARAGDERPGAGGASGSSNKSKNSLMVVREFEPAEA